MDPLLDPPSRLPRAGRSYHAPTHTSPFTPHKPFRGLSVLSRGETPLAAVRKHRGTDCLRSRPPYRPESQSPRPVPLPTPPAPPRSPGRTARSLLRRIPTACRQRFVARLRGLSTVYSVACTPLMHSLSTHGPPLLFDGRWSACVRGVHRCAAFLQAQSRTQAPHSHTLRL